MIFIYVLALRNTASSLMYTMYRYIAVEEFANAPAGYAGLMIPAVIAGAIGAVLCICYLLKNRRKG